MLEWADLLALLCVMFPCVFVTSTYGVLGRRGNLLYRFLIFVFFLTLIHIRVTGEVRAVKHIILSHPVNFLLTVTRRCFFCRSFLLFLFHIRLHYTVLSIHCSLVVTCWERADVLALLCVMFCMFLSPSHIISWVRCGA